MSQPLRIARTFWPQPTVRAKTCSRGTAARARPICKSKQWRMESCHILPLQKKSTGKNASRDASIRQSNPFMPNSRA
jgi:hypothetical protein